MFLNNKTIKTEDFIEKIQAGGEFLLPRVEITVGMKVVRGHGKLIAKKEGLFANIKLSKNAIAPGIPTGIQTRKDCWSIKGRIQEGPNFKSSKAWCIQGQWASLGMLGLKLDSITLLPEKEESLNREQSLRRFKRVIPGGAPMLWREPCSMQFIAIFLNAELIFKNTATVYEEKNPFFGPTGRSVLDTFLDLGDDYDFALRQVNENVHLHIRGKDALKNGSREDHWRLVLS
jgi:hypothetical protein